MLNEELIYLDLEADNSEELLSLLSDKLYEKGYVKESFKKSHNRKGKSFSYRSTHTRC